MGCGIKGGYHELLADFEVDGVDISEPPIQPSHFRCHQCDVVKLPFVANNFDLAIVIEFLSILRIVMKLSVKFFLH